MKLERLGILMIFFCLVLAACKDDTIAGPDPQVSPEPVTEEPISSEFAEPDVAAVLQLMVDKNATDETAALYYNLKMISRDNILVGQQDAYSGFHATAGTGSEVSDMKLLTKKILPYSVLILCLLRMKKTQASLITGGFNKRWKL